MSKFREYQLRALNCREAQLKAAPHLRDAYEALARKWEQLANEQMTSLPFDTDVGAVWLS